MSRPRSLLPAERELFHLVERAAFANPFGEERARIDRQIAGAEPTQGDGDRARWLLPPLASAIARLEADGRDKLSAYAGADREMLEAAFLFEMYQRRAEDLDRLIRDQLTAGDEPCAVPFARQVLGELARRGFTGDEARRWLSLLYQIRRAYHFIGTALVGESACMKDLRRRLWQNVMTHDIGLYGRHLMERMEDFSTLLLGETGTGKGTAAAAIGRSGPIPFDEKRGCFAESFTRAFIAINLSQYPEALIESERFGHKKGAFTGAIGTHEGVFARCSQHGAIFLDEIGEVSIPVQIKLLEVLQDRAFSPVGSHERRRFRGRVVAATNRAVDRLRERGAFRDDFFYRVSSDVITLPPLRQRLAEDPRELERLVGQVVRRMVGEDTPRLVELALDVLHRSLPREYPWPGNVRELEQAVRRVLLTREYAGDVTTSAAPTPTRYLRSVQEGALDARQLLAGYCKLLFDQHGTVAAVARKTGLDPRTVKKHVVDASGVDSSSGTPDLNSPGSRRR